MLVGRQEGHPARKEYGGVSYTQPTVPECHSAPPYPLQDFKALYKCSIIIIIIIIIIILLTAKCCRADRTVLKSSKYLHRNCWNDRAANILYWWYATSGQSNLTKRPHRCSTWTVQSCSPGGANLHPYLIHASLDQSSHIKWHLDQFSSFCTGHCKPSLYFTTGCPFPIKIAHFHGGSEPPLIHGF